MLPYNKIFSALASCAARQFSVCSRAFIKLESLTTIPPQERDAYSKLALTIFTKYVDLLPLFYHL
uniref:Secreted protein n=1 Tax=Ascaris lumbricoides TaxID=6252 RepID=A0A0M3HHQ3_ASCLU